MTFSRDIVLKPLLLAAVGKIGNDMTKQPKSIYAGFALALVLAIGIHSPAMAEASAESQELALQLVQRAELKKLAGEMKELKALVAALEGKSTGTVTVSLIK